MPLNSFHLITCLQVLGEADPQLPARLLALITCRDELPLAFRFTVERNERVTVEMTLPGLDPEEGRRLTDKVRKIPTVISATATLVGRSVTSLRQGESLPA